MNLVSFIFVADHLMHFLSVTKKLVECDNLTVEDKVIIRVLVPRAPIAPVWLEIVREELTCNRCFCNSSSNCRIREDKEIVKGSESLVSMFTNNSCGSVGCLGNFWGAAAGVGGRFVFILFT